MTQDEQAHCGQPGFAKFYLLRGQHVEEGYVQRKWREIGSERVNSGGVPHSPRRSLERGGSLCPLFDLCLQMARQEIKDERRF